MLIAKITKAAEPDYQRIVSVPLSNASPGETEEQTISRIASTTLMAGETLSIVEAATLQPTKAALRTYAATKANNFLSLPRSYTSGDVTISADATQGTRIDLTNLMTWGAANEAETHPWVADDGTVTEATGAQFVAIGHLVGAYALSVYATLAAALTGINATPATITTTAQIDALNWPV